MLPDRSILIGQKLAGNAKIQKFKFDILNNFQTTCSRRVTRASKNYETKRDLSLFYRLICVNPKSTQSQPKVNPKSTQSHQKSPKVTESHRKLPKVTESHPKFNTKSTQSDLKPFSGLWVGLESLLVDFWLVCVDFW